MSETSAPAPNRGSRIMALLVVALLILVPAGWVAWSLHAASVSAEAIDSQSLLVASLRARLAELGEGPESTAAITDLSSVYLPGETAAIAGAALQTLVAGKVEAVGGRLLESELGVAEPEEDDPGRIGLRVSFETEIAGLQRVIFELETGTPIVIIRGLDVRAVDATEIDATQSPTLRVVLLVDAYREAVEPPPAEG